MGDHRVEIGTGAGGTTFDFPAVFNVAVPFIDRHLDEGRGNKLAIRCVAGDEVTYAELAERVGRCGNALIGLGLEAGERVLMVVKDSPEFMYLFWGAIKAGIVPVPLNTMLRTDDYRYMIEDSGASAVIYSPEFAAEMEPALAAAAPGPAHALRTEGEGETLASLISAAEPGLEPAATAPEDDCFWLYSSGSTGRPKGAVHVHRGLVLTSQYYGVETLGMGKDDSCFSAAKLFFAYGLGNAMTFPLWVGGTAVLMADRPTPESTFDAIGRFKPTYYFGVPTLYAAQLQAMETGAAKPELGSLRHCISAGEALPPDILRRWGEATGISLLEGIGSTEALHIYISNFPGEARPGSTGRLVPGYEARIVDEAGADVAQGESGQLMIKGESSSRYYWNKPEKTAQTMVGGWLNTGDTYLQDEDGYFIYCGRSDDMMKVGGIWCSPFEIEAKLVEHPDVLEAAVVGRADDADLIKPEAWITAAEGATPGPELEAALREHCKTGLAPYKYPRWFHFVDDLPKTATGKIQRFKLRAG
jgi:benzoate-CoA ligase family protein